MNKIITISISLVGLLFTIPVLLPKTDSASSGIENVLAMFFLMIVGTPTLVFTTIYFLKREKLAIPWLILICANVLSCVVGPIFIALMF